MRSMKEKTHLWSVILAGGEGEQVRPFVQNWLGYHRPKQYCTFVGTRSMFQHTVDRAVQLTVSNRVLAVVGAGHQAEVARQTQDREIGQLLYQPANRETAAGVFLALSYIGTQDPDATVLLLPSDHFIAPEERFLDVASCAVRTAQWMPERFVVLGVRPDGPEQEYGWIVPERVRAYIHRKRVFGVKTFIEKPDAARAQALLLAGGFWNTLVLAAKVDTLWHLGWMCFPEIMPRFERLRKAIGTPEEAHLLETIYATMPPRNFSSGMLAGIPERVLMLELQDICWSDWGRPERILRSLQQIGSAPCFPAHCIAAASG